jgi:hypothetical protein
LDKDGPELYKAQGAVKALRALEFELGEFLELAFSSQEEEKEKKDE